VCSIFSSWDALYTTELSNHDANPTDEGTVWFDDSDAEQNLVRFFDEREQEQGQEQEGTGDGGHSEKDSLEHATAISAPTTKLKLERPATSFLDLGCGNGSLLVALREDGWEGSMLGVDYSARSIQLAEDVARSRFGGETVGVVRFKAWDVLRGEHAAVLGEAGQRDGWDVVLDKGTFDAICLSDERDQDGKRVCEGYRDRVLECVRRGGLFVVTSCNWTEDELRGWFLGGGGHGVGRARFVEDGRIEYRAISFGGVKGQTISTLCFRKVC